MVKIINKNILDCTEDIIVHQVNCQGIMRMAELRDNSPNATKDWKKIIDYFAKVMLIVMSC